jgi:prepilin-type N-terminal cleavage/methylation domain-containing protein
MAHLLQCRRRVKRERGFTLVEMSVVVALIAVLAAIVVPIFMSEHREATGDAEVNALFTELGIKEQQYMVENGTYLSTGASESDTWPAAPSKSSQALQPLPASWVTLKVQPPESTAKCGYVVIAGDAGVDPGAIATGMFGMTTPQQPYYYVLAHCDLDGDSAKDGYYFQSSIDTTIQKLNAGY